MFRAITIGAAGAAGALPRYAIGVGIGATAFPWATLGINVIGSFALGYVLGGPAGSWSTSTTATVTIGFLGAFTTFSTFTFDTTALTRSGRLMTAATYLGCSIALGLGASAAGYWLAAQRR